MLKINNELSGLGKVIWLVVYITVGYLLIRFIWEALGWWYLAIVVGLAFWWWIVNRHEPEGKGCDGQQT